SRRRHTRSKRDWSSDVCSSDLFLFALIDILINKTAIHLKFFNNSINLFGSENSKPLQYKLYRVDVHSGHRTTDQVAYSRLVPDQIGRASCRERGAVSVRTVGVN